MYEFAKTERLVPLLSIAKATRAAYPGKTPTAKLRLLGGVSDYLEQKVMLGVEGIPACDKDEWSKLRFNTRVGIRLLREIFLDDQSLQVFRTQAACPSRAECSAAQLLFLETFDAICALYPRMRIRGVYIPKLKKPLEVVEYWLIHAEAPMDDESGKTLPDAGLAIHDYLTSADNAKNISIATDLNWPDLLGAVDLVNYHNNRARGDYSLLEQPEWLSSDDTPVNQRQLETLDKPQQLTSPRVVSLIRDSFVADWNRWTRVNHLSSACLLGV